MEPFHDIRNTDEPFSRVLLTETMLSLISIQLLKPYS
jgi:hypothetical protein